MTSNNGLDTTQYNRGECKAAFAHAKGVSLDDVIDWDRQIDINHDQITF